MWTLILGLPVRAGLVALLQFVADVRVARGCQQRRQPVVVLDDLVGHRARLDLAGPADQLRHPEGALPVGVLLAAERRGAAVGPGIAMRAVVGGVQDDGVLGDTEFVQHIEHRADVLVVVDHRVVVLRLPETGLSATFRLGVGEGVHVGEVAPHEERVARVVLTLDVVDRGVGDVVVDRFHPLRVERAGVLDRLLADRAELRVVRFGRHRVERLALEHAARLRQVVQPGIAVLVRVVELLRFLLGVEVVQVAEELVEPVQRRQVLVQVAEVVLAELTRRVSERLE